MKFQLGRGRQTLRHASKSRWTILTVSVLIPLPACDAPRWIVTEGLEVAVERGFKEKVLEDLRKREHALTESSSSSDLFFGGAQLVYRLEQGFFAASDHRRDGQALGY